MSLHTSQNCGLYRHHYQGGNVLLPGITDMDKRRDVLSMKNILDRPVKEVISLVESKEMARDALLVSSAGISSSIHRGPHQLPDHHLCRIAIRLEFAQTVRGRSRYSLKVLAVGILGSINNVSHVTGLKETRARHLSGAGRIPHNAPPQMPPGPPHLLGLVPYLRRYPAFRNLSTRTLHRRNAMVAFGLVHAVHLPPRSALTVSSLRVNGAGPVSWITQKFNCTCLYTLQTIGPSTNAVHPSNDRPSLPWLTQGSSLWSMDDFLAAGFTNEDLIPVKLDLHTTNRSPIHVNSAIILHLQGMPPRDNKQSCNLCEQFCPWILSLPGGHAGPSDVTSQLPLSRCHCTTIAGPRLNGGSTPTKRPTYSKHRMLYTIGSVISVMLMYCTHSDPRSSLCPAIRVYPH